MRLRTPRPRTTLALAAVLGTGTACESPEPLDTTLGISESLAAARAATLSEIAYEVSLTVPEKRAEPLTGRTTIRFVWDDPAGRSVVVDFMDPGERVDGVTVNGEPIEWTAANDHVVIPAGTLVAGGNNEIELTYRAGDEALNRSDDFLYTLFVPDRAHFSLPVFDQPDLKAPITWEISVPDGWIAVGNGPALEEPDGHTGRRSYRLAESEPLPTYLFAFAAGRFRVEEAEQGGRRLRIVHRETDEERVAANRDEIFDLVASSLAWMEEYTGIPYPFAKYDLVLIPPFQYGGMEHPGAVFYRQSSLILDESPTQGQVLGRASLIAHETAHMWFGDLVTMKWFDDVWTKEVFANFMAAKIVHPSFPEIDHDLRFLLAHHPAAYGIDRTPGANPIRQPLDNLREAGTLYGPIIYQKAPIVMRHLERTVGEEAFRDGLREYLERYRYGNATWPDLIAILDDRSDEDLAEWSRVWVEEPGRPEIEVALEREGDRVKSLELLQSDPWGMDRIWPQELELVAAYGDSLVRDTVTLDRAGVTLEDWAGRPAPDWILPVGAGIEYGLFVLDDTSLGALLEALPSLRPALVRGAAWLTVRDAMLEGRVEPERVLELALAGLAHETEEQLVQMLLGVVGDIHWRYLPDETRQAEAARIEEALWRGVGEAGTSSLKASWFGAYRSLATTDEALARLERIWAEEEAIPGLPLSENDFTSLANELALRGVDGAEEILDRQAERIENPDRRARFDFVRPSLSDDPVEREAFFESLRDPARREQEPWVLSGLTNLSHPLRRAHAEPFVLPALGLLEEIQRTGDIFFPQRWLGAVLGEHNSPAVVRTVAEFLAARPDYPPRLRAKILQSADGVRRAALLVHGGPVAELPAPGGLR